MAHDPRYADVQDLTNVPDHQLAEISPFFEVYKELEPGKSTDVRGWQGRAAAEREISAAIARCQSETVAGRRIRWSGNGKASR